MPQFRGKAVPLYFGRQADIKTAATSGNYANSYMYSLTPGGEQGFEDDPILGGNLNNQRDATAPAPALASSSAALSLPSCMNHLGYALEMAFGTPTFEAGVSAAPNKRVYTSGSDTLPYSTIAYAIGTNFRRLEGFMAGSLGFNVSRSAGFGRVSLDGAARRFHRPTDLGLGVVPAPLDLVRSPAYRGIFRVDGVAEASILTAAPKYENTLDLVDFANDSEFVGDIRPGDSKFMSPSTFRFSSSFYADKAAEAFNGDAGLFAAEWEWNAPSGTKLILKAPNCRIAPSSEAISGPGGIEVSYDIVAEQTAADPMLTVELYNFVADGGYL